MPGLQLDKIKTSRPNRRDGSFYINYLFFLLAAFMRGVVVRMRLRMRRFSG